MCPECFVKFCIILTLTSCSRIAHFGSIKAITCSSVAVAWGNWNALLCGNIARFTSVEGLWQWLRQCSLRVGTPEGRSLIPTEPCDLSSLTLWQQIDRLWHTRGTESVSAGSQVDLWSIRVVKGALTRTHRVKDSKLPGLSVWSELVLLFLWVETPPGNQTSA